MNIDRIFKTTRNRPQSRVSRTCEKRTYDFHGKRPGLELLEDWRLLSVASPQIELFNYSTGDRSNWRSNVPSFAKVEYAGLYSGIDLKTWGQRNSVKYEFHVAPGADYRQIQVHCAGIAGLSLAADGSSHVNLGGDWGSLLDNAP
jgi:hypothetical protein